MIIPNDPGSCSYFSSRQGQMMKS